MPRTFGQQVARLVVVATCWPAHSFGPSTPSRRLSLAFDGVNDYLTVPDADRLTFGNGVADTPLTFEMWIRPETMAVRQGLLSKWSDPPNVEYRLYVAAGNTLRLDFRDNSAQATASAYVAGNLSSLQGGWHHLAVTYDGRGGSTAADGIAFYVDGLVVPVVRVNNPAYVAMENGTRALQIGRESGGVSQYGGGLDELRLWNVARTPSQLQAHMAAELSAIEPGLIGYWKFNEGTGTTAADDAGNGLTATLFNSPTWTAGGPIGSTTPDVTPPEITDIATVNLTASGNTISFRTNEITTGWVSLAPNGACPCVDVYSPALGTNHVITVTGLASDTLYTYEVKAIDGAGNLRVEPGLSFRTLLAQPDSTPPTVSITNPSAGAVSGTVLVDVSAADNIGVVGVQLKVDDVNLGVEDLVAPYSTAWDTNTAANGPHTLAATARDAAGNLSVASVTVTVSNGQSGEAPHYLAFDGVNDYLTVPDADRLTFGNGVADTPLTFEMWIRPETMAVRQSLLSKWSDPPNVEYRLYIAPGNTLRLDFRDNSAQATASAYVAGNLSSLQGGWHHLAVTYDGRGGSTAADGITFYVDGLVVRSGAREQPRVRRDGERAAPLQIGRESGGVVAV